MSWQKKFKGKEQAMIIWNKAVVVASQSLGAFFLRFGELSLSDMFITCSLPIVWSGKERGDMMSPLTDASLNCEPFAS